MGANSDGALELSGWNIELLLGHKQLSTPYFGWRGYFNLSGGEVKKKKETKLEFVSYTLNADALYNFIANDSVSFSAFGYRIRCG